MRIAVVVTSDRVYKGEASDRIRPILDELERANVVEVAYYNIVPNDPQKIRKAVIEATRNSRIVIVTGGTGLSPRDVTVDSLRPIASKELPGFGELHRRLSLEDIGYRAIMSRATAYIINGSLVAVSPGNPGAFKLALDILRRIYKHILEELGGGGHGKHIK